MILVKVGDAKPFRKSAPSFARLLISTQQYHYLLSLFRPKPFTWMSWLRTGANSSRSFSCSLYKPSIIYTYIYYIYKYAATFTLNTSKYPTLPFFSVLFLSPSVCLSLSLTLSLPLSLSISLSLYLYFIDHDARSFTQRNHHQPRWQSRSWTYSVSERASSPRGAWQPIQRKWPSWDKPNCCLGTCWWPF